MFVIVMGVTGSGKSTIGKLLAERVNLPFYDADDYHSPENRAKMAADVPLNEADRRPWLEHLARLAVDWEAAGGAVLACSALKQAHRDLLVERIAEHRIVYLDLPRATAERRLAARRGHHQFVRDFEHLLDGQYRDLEPPTDALSLASNLPVAEIVSRAAAFILGE
ncbi:MAG: gluconokinase, GntK/IdnK-type [Polyangiaceae bacterium]